MDNVPQVSLNKFVDSFRTRLEMAAENDKKDDEEDEKQESGKVGKWTLQVEKSPRGHQTHRVQQIPRTPPRIQIPPTPLERAPHE